MTEEFTACISKAAYTSVKKGGGGIAPLAPCILLPLSIYNMYLICEIPNSNPLNAKHSWVYRRDQILELGEWKLIQNLTKQVLNSRIFHVVLSHLDTQKGHQI